MTYGKSVRLLVVMICVATFTVAIRAQEEADRRAGATTNRMLDVDEQANRLSPVTPTPQESSWGRGVIDIGSTGRCTCTVEIRGEQNGAALIAAELFKRVRQRFGASMSADGGSTRFLFTVTPKDAPEDSNKIAERLRTIGREGYVLQTGRAQGRPYVLVAGNSDVSLWHGMVTVVQLMSRRGDALTFPEIDMTDYPHMSERALLVDMGGQGFMVGPSRWELGQWKELVDWMVDNKLNALWLEFIGSGRLMGNLNMDAGEWVGFPVALKSHPELVAKDRPIRRWDEDQNKIVSDTYTVPNVARDFVRELIDYAQARGVKCYLLIGYDYFANQLPVVLKIPANDPSNRAANKVYDDMLRETTERYSNASGVILQTIENKEVPPSIIHEIVRRTSEGKRIVKMINPSMEVGLLADYLEWQPNQLEDIALLKKSFPDVFLAYSPHREPQQKSWQRVHGDVWRYMNYTQYAWDRGVYIFPDQIREEIQSSFADGYRKTVTQAWYDDVFALNYRTFAEYSWNTTSTSTAAFWNRTLQEQFGPAKDLMRTALAHTRFDLRFDLIARMILDNKIDREFTYWDMYKLHRFKGLTDSMLSDLQDDAEQSLAAAQAGLSLAPPSAREMVQSTITSAERRLYLATSGRHLLKALGLKKQGDVAAARSEMDLCVREGEKMFRAATRLGIEFPLSVHDDELLDRYVEIRKSMGQ